MDHSPDGGRRFKIAGWAWRTSGITMAGARSRTAMSCSTDVINVPADTRSAAATLGCSAPQALDPAPDEAWYTTVGLVQSTHDVHHRTGTRRRRAVDRRGPSTVGCP